MNNYCFQGYEKERMSRALGKDLPISIKQSVEITKWIRKKDLVTVKKLLQDVIDKKRAVPYTRYNGNVGHKKGIGPGRFPKKASRIILKVIESAEKNAQQKGLNTGSLVLIHISANKASTPLRYGRKGGVEAKRTNIEVVLEEVAKKEDKKQKKTFDNKERVAS